MPAWSFASLHGYRLAWLPRDLLAGLMLAAIAIPGQLATARLAGMPPETGLYAFAAGSLAFAALGANRFMSVAADSTIAPIFAGALSSIAAIGTAHYAELATLLAILVGVILLAVGLLRAGWLATLLSIPVTTGFLAGISIHIIVGQLPDLLGLPGAQGHMLVRLVHILGDIGAINLYTFALGAGVLAVTLVTARMSHRLPGALIGLVGAGLAVAAFHLEARGVSVVGALAVPPPRLALPANPGIGEWSQLVPLALVVAMVCIMQTAAVASTFPSDRDRPDDTSRDFLGVGAGSILAGLIGSFAVDSSPPSTAIVRDSGGRSQIASLTAVALMIALAVLAAGLLAYVPRAALAGILVYIAIKIFRLGEMIRIWRRGGLEILLVAASAGLVVVLPIESGMLLAIVLSFVHSLYIVARPYCAELARVPGTTVWWPPSARDHVEHEPGVLVFALAAPLNFTNVQNIIDRIRAVIASRRPPVKLLVLEASGVIDIDYTGSELFQHAIANLKAKGVTVAIARLSHEQAQREARRSGLTRIVGKDHVFMSVEEAVQKLRPGQGSSAPPRPQGSTTAAS
jgi:MFS superfamily sulfate permease-like transporter